MVSNGSMRNHAIQSVDGTLRFRGRLLSQGGGPVRLATGLRARMKVQVYVTDCGAGVIREEVKVANRTATFIHRIHPGTSPGWERPGDIPQGTKILNDTWDRACAVESSLRPVRKWQITEGYREIRIRTGPDTYLEVRTS